MRTRHVVRAAAVLTACVLAGRATARAETAAAFTPPAIARDLWDLVVPTSNPVTPAKVALGRQLYFGTRLSRDGNVSCAACHDPDKGFADGRKVAVGIGGKSGARNSPTVLNAMFNELQFWDGRAATLEEQAKGPLVNPVEMGFASLVDAEAAVKAIPAYQAKFKEVFGREPNIDDIAAAIATFERTVVSWNSPFDRFIAGETSAMSEAAQRGWKLWNGKSRCSTCHAFNESSPFFTDNKFHNIGVAAKGRDFSGLAREAAAIAGDAKALAELSHKPDYAELGRFLVTQQPKDIGAFKTSGLRDIALTAPYMHDGSEATLRDVVEFYDKGGEANPNLDGGIVALNLTEQEKSDLVAFMEALTGAGAGAPNRAELRAPKAGEESR